MRLRPNRRASTDHAPGPSIASAAPKAPSSMCVHGSLENVNARHVSATAIITPATGVQKPISNIAAAPASTNCKTTSAGIVVVRSPVIPCRTSGIAATARKNKSPVPGQPSGNVEKSRCTRAPVLRLSLFSRHRNPKKQIAWTPLSRGLEVDDPALQPDGNGMCPIVGAQLGENVLDVALDGFFRDGELGSDFFVCIPARDEPQNLYFP
jgi:hypothetical protein